MTATGINLVYYYAQPGGLASTISSAAGTPAQAWATVQAYVAMLNKIYVLYGRHVNLIPFEASGADTDPVAAHADAVTVAEQDHAFASIGGPGDTMAYETELARLHVLCIGCGDSSLNALIQQDAPDPMGHTNAQALPACPPSTTSCSAARISDPSRCRAFADSCKLEGRLAGSKSRRFAPSFPTRSSM